MQVRVDEDVVDLRHRGPERVRHMVGEHQRARTGAALAAVDADEVGPATGLRHVYGQLVPERHLADRSLDADGHASGIGDGFDELHHPGDVVER